MPVHPPRRRSAKSRLQGLTIIEVLIVIAIITMAIPILVPSGCGTRESGGAHKSGGTCKNKPASHLLHRKSQRVVPAVAPSATPLAPCTPVAK